MGKWANYCVAWRVGFGVDGLTGDGSGEGY